MLQTALLLPESNALTSGYVLQDTSVAAAVRYTSVRPASRKPRTGEHLATDGRDGSGYADRQPTRFPCPAGSATAAGPAPPGVMTWQGYGT